MESYLNQTERNITQNHKSVGLWVLRIEIKEQREIVLLDRGIFRKLKRDFKLWSLREMRELANGEWKSGLSCVAKEGVTKNENERVKWRSWIENMQE